jgi:CBS domain-containing membrane protein
MAPMLTIADIMTEDVFAIEAATPLEEVAWALSARNISSAPVRDERGHLIGVITKADITDPERGAWSERARLRPVAAADVMSPRIALARADEPAMKAVRLLTGKDPRQVVVLDARDRVVGIVTPWDVLRALAYGDGLV